MLTSTRKTRFISNCHCKKLNHQAFISNLFRFLFFRLFILFFLTSRYQFHQHFTHVFFVRKFCAKLFCTYILGLNFFLTQAYRCKYALKILVKLATVLSFFVFFSSMIYRTFLVKVRSSLFKPFIVVTLSPFFSNFSVIVLPVVRAHSIELFSSVD
jgi:hypothetical protein